MSCLQIYPQKRLSLFNGLTYGGYNSFRAFEERIILEAEYINIVQPHKIFTANVVIYDTVVCKMMCTIKFYTESQFGSVKI